MEMRCDVAVIGAGSAGLKAWREAEAAGAHAVIVEEGPGGTTCARVGCMPSKLLLSSAHRAAAVRTADRFGVRATLDAVDGPAVMRRLRAERDRFVAAALEGWEAIPADRRLDGTARFAAPGVLAVGDVTVQAGAVVIAAGGRPAVDEALTPVAALVHTHETVFEIDDLPRDLAVLGAGAIGLELGQAFAELGVRVTVIDASDAVAGVTDPAVARAAAQAVGRTLDLRLGCRLDDAAMADGRARLRWTGDTPGEGLFDMVLAAAGRPPDLSRLCLNRAGVALDERGTPLFDPETRRCGDAPVFVAGDAGASRPVLHEASWSGRTAGRGAAGLAPDTARPPAFSVTFASPQIAAVGAAWDDLPPGAVVGQAAMADNGRARIEAGGQPDGMVRLYAGADGALLGAAMLGEGVEHVAHLAAFAVARGLSVREVADLPFYHPTVEEALREAACDALERLG